MKILKFNILLFLAIALGCSNPSTEMVNGNQAPTGIARKARANETEMTGTLNSLANVSELIYTLTIKDESTGQLLDFETNLQDLGLTKRELKKKQGEKIKVYFETNAKPTLVDLHFKGASIYGANAPKQSDEWQDITGQLTGADAVTPQDAVGNIAILAADGKIMVFECSVTQDIAAINNQEVTIFYQNTSANRITYLE
ncbi:MAG: hypothetical protein RLZZ337_790 [Bacteroidota bacterium]|jgi:hypothetical protein